MTFTYNDLKQIHDQLSELHGGHSDHHAFQPFVIVLEAENPGRVSAELETRFGEIAVIEPLFAHVDGPGDPLAQFIRLEFFGVDRALVSDAAFEFAHALRKEFGLISAEPVVERDYFPVPGEMVGVAETEWAMVKGACEVEDYDVGDLRWALKLIEADTAIDFSRANGRPAAGIGIRVAQPDTGYRIVSGLEAVSIDPTGGWSLFSNSAGATDPINYKGHPGHGTATGSCVVSKGYGVAPDAILYPIRCINNVVVLDADRVARAIEHATLPATNIDVITMSLGGVPSRAVRAAIRQAIGRGIIVLAAAGNCVGLVVWPARYSDCIAVAGCNTHRKPWKGSSSGNTVDVTAPGELVYHATVDTNLPNKKGQGTSFAVALTAGVAAQWLAHFGKAAVQAKAAERGTSVQALFRSALRQTVTAAVDLKPDKFGGGIVNARRLLKLGLDAIQVLGVHAAPGDDDAVPEDFREIYEAFAQGTPASENLRNFDWAAYGQELGHIALNRSRTASARYVEMAETTPTPASGELEQASTVDTVLEKWVGGNERT